MLDAAVSPRSIARAVDRRGERWGLHAKIRDDGTVAVCDMVYETEVRSGVGVARKVERELRTVDEDAPFSGALAGRIDNGEIDLSRRYKSAEQADRQRRQRAMDAYDDETRKIWRERRRATFLPGNLFSPSGLVERAMHWRRTR